MSRVKITLSEGRPVRVAFKCPGCDSTHDLPVRGEAPQRSWGFNGSAERPTLTPSILATTGPFPEDTKAEDILGRDKLNAARCLVCHSFVTDGRIQFLGDCTHELAGQTVELPELE